METGRNIAKENIVTLDTYVAIAMNIYGFLNYCARVSEASTTIYDL